MKAVIPMVALVPALLACVVTHPAGAQSDPKERTPAPSGAARPTDSGPPGKLRISGRVDVGDPAPAFELSGTSGSSIAMSRIRGDWLLLVFARQLGEFTAFSSVTGQLAEHGVRVFGITREGLSRLRTHVQRTKTEFELLSDPTGDVSAVYGLYDGAENATRPGYVLVDRRGIIRLAVLGQSFAPGQVAELVQYTIENH